jgi:hypothetical protein
LPTIFAFLIISKTHLKHSNFPTYKFIKNKFIKFTTKMFSFRLAIVAALCHKVVFGAEHMIRSSKYLRSSISSGGNRAAKGSKNQGLFTYHTGETVSSTMTSTASSLTQVNTVSQGSAATTSTVTVSGVIAVYSKIQQFSRVESLANAEISLQDQSGQTIRTTTAKSDGTWTFANVEAGYYKLKIDVPSGFLVMGYNSNDISITVDSKKNSVTLMSYLLGSSCYTSVGSVLGTLVGLDSYSDVTISISNLSGNIIATTKADVSGKFEFMNLLEDTYSIHVDIPSLDSSMVTSTSTNVQVTVLPNQVTTINVRPTYTYTQNEADIGVKSNTCGSINGFAWVDFDKNGLKTSKGSGLMDVSVSLYQMSGTAIATVKTDSVGFYSFSCIGSGVYYVKFENPWPDILDFSGKETEPDNQANNGGVVDNIVVKPAQSTTVSGGLIFKPGVRCGPHTSNDLELKQLDGAYGVILHCGENHNH